ncbi:LysE family translocator [Porticoccaceae bacterium LTM1]|nr:LysE family translocator [Porticoccaceae bacterium LTM1]
MNLETLAALAAFALVSSITPGPNNIMLMTSGVNFGFRRTTPHMLGVAIGFTIMVVLVGIGVVQIFDLLPASYFILKIVSITYLLFLAFKIATSAPPSDETKSDATPLTFMQAALFQWVNPKAWMMAITAISIYAPSKSLYAVSLVALVFGLVNLPSVSVWTVMGLHLRRLLTNTKRLRAFNASMAILLVLSLYPVVL